MNKIYLVVFTLFALVISSCATRPHASHSDPSHKSSPAPGVRAPGSVNLSGAYLGEGLFSTRTAGLKRPAFRMYLDQVQGEADSYYGVLLEYDQLLKMGLPYIASQKAPLLNKVVGYLDAIATRISAYKFVPGAKPGSYHLYNLEVRNGQIVPASDYKMVLTLDLNNGHDNPLTGAKISGNTDGAIVFPRPEDKATGVVEALKQTQFELAQITYKLGKLGSTWRGNWNELEGSYLSEYGRFTDGVLELYSQNGQQRAKFVKSNNTKAKYFTNPKSATIEGDYTVTEPVPKMYLLVPTGKTRTASDIEMSGRIGLFLDVFDGSAPEAGSHLVTEIAYTNPQDPEDFMMYYEHPEHKKNVGVEPKK